jgi:uncharacterized protein (TIGR03086 family)
MDLIAALEETYRRAEEVVDGIREDQWDDPTPCVKWNVRELLRHFIGSANMFGVVLSGGNPTPPPEAPALGDDPATTFAEAAARNLEVWRKRGSLDGTVPFSIGEIPAEMAARFNVQEVLAHTWDLARATGQDPALPPEVAADALEFAQGAIKPEFRDANGDPIAPPVDVSPDAPIGDRFAAFLGRRP